MWGGFAGRTVSFAFFPPSLSCWLVPLLILMLALVASRVVHVVVMFQGTHADDVRTRVVAAFARRDFKGGGDCHLDNGGLAGQTRKQIYNVPPTLERFSLEKMQDVSTRIERVTNRTPTEAFVQIIKDMEAICDKYADAANLDDDRCPDVLDRLLAFVDGTKKNNYYARATGEDPALTTTLSQWGQLRYRNNGGRVAIVTSSMTPATHLGVLDERHATVAVQQGSNIWIYDPSFAEPPSHQARVGSIHGTGVLSTMMRIKPASTDMYIDGGGNRNQDCYRMAWPWGR